MFQQSLFVLTFLWMVSSIGAFMTPMQHLPTTLSSCSELHAATKSDGPETFKKADLVNIVSGKTGLTKVQTEAALQAMLTTIQEQVALDRKVTLPGFGIFTLRERSARKGRNPQTGEELDIASSKSPGFAAAKPWKDALNGKTVAKAAKE